MKSLVKRIFIFKFKILTWFYLKVNRIEVIAITGSVGKTCTKNAISQFLSNGDVYVPEENYNTEIGLPLAIFKERTPENLYSIAGWLKITLSMFSKLFKKAPYKRIVLEMAAERQGDIKYLTSFIKPTVAIVTAVLPVHLEEFKTVQNVAREKSALIDALKKKGLAILNIDDRYVRLMGERTRAKKVWIGEDKRADIRWQNVVFKPKGITFDLILRNQTYKIRAKFLAPQLLISLLSAVAVGLHYNLEIRDLITKLENYKPEKGRMNILKGMNGSTIIDDSYNANPSSVLAALNVLKEMPGRKIAVLGSMNELGSVSVSGHKEVGRKAAEVADIIITVGEDANKYIAGEAKGKRKKVKKLENSRKAGEELKSIIKEGDFILVKGSQNGVYMEEAVKEILAEPEKAPENLVRQSKMWDEKKSYMNEEGAK